jgi:hypothetical protein
MLKYVSVSISVFFGRPIPSSMKFSVYLAYISVYLFRKAVFEKVLASKKNPCFGPFQLWQRVVRTNTIFQSVKIELFEYYYSIGWEAMKITTGGDYHQIGLIGMSCIQNVQIQMSCCLSLSCHVFVLSCLVLSCVLSCLVLSRLVISCLV